MPPARTSSVTLFSRSKARPAAAAPMRHQACGTPCTVAGSAAPSIAPSASPSTALPQTPMVVKSEACPKSTFTCVTLGVSSSAEVTFNARDFFVAGRTTLYGLYLFTELMIERASVGLRRLGALVAAGQLAPHVSVERPWTEIGQVAQDLIARRFPGKAVLTV